jgi:hypothetical protein
VCAAGPAADVGRLITMARGDGWTVQIIATPAALDFTDVPALETQTGSPVRSQYRKPNEPKPPRADAIIAAPATYNTIKQISRRASPTPTPSACSPKLPDWASPLSSCRS